MTLESADLDMDLFYVDSAGRDSAKVMLRGLVEARETNNELTGREVQSSFVCECADRGYVYDEVYIDNTLAEAETNAKQIAHALNRLPKLERLLVDIAGVLRSDDAEALNAMADEIEEMICG